MTKKITQIDEALGIMGLGLALGASMGVVKNISKINRTMDARDRISKSRGGYSIRDAQKRIRQRLIDLSNPKSELHKARKRKQDTRRRQAEKVAATLPSGNTVRKKLTKKAFGASNARNSTPKDNEKGIKITNHGFDARTGKPKYSTRYEMLSFKDFVMLQEGSDKLRIHRNPDNLEGKVSMLLKNSTYGELKGIADHTTGHVYVWDSSDPHSNHGEVAAGRLGGKLGKKISAFTINGHYNSIEHSHEDDSSMPSHHDHASFEEHKKHPRVKAIAKKLGFTHDSADY